MLFCTIFLEPGLLCREHEGKQQGQEWLANIRATASPAGPTSSLYTSRSGVSASRGMCQPAGRGNKGGSLLQ